MSVIIVLIMGLPYSSANGNDPLSIVNNTTPKLQMSTFSVYAPSPRPVSNISGATYLMSIEIKTY